MKPKAALAKTMIRMIAASVTSPTAMESAVAMSRMIIRMSVN